MTFYNDPENAQQYIEMAAGYDGAKLIAILREYLPDGATVLRTRYGARCRSEIVVKTFHGHRPDYARPF